MHKPGVLTPELTIGPFFPTELLGKDTHRLNPIDPEMPTRMVKLSGRVLDENGVGVSRSLLEIEYKEIEGLAVDSICSGPNSARTLSDDDGCYLFELYAPRSNDALEELPPLFMNVFCSDPNRLSTEIYFPDPALYGALRKEPHDNGALLTVAEPIGNPVDMYRFDIRLRGAQETIFYLD